MIIIFCSINTCGLTDMYQSFGKTAVFILRGEDKATVKAVLYRPRQFLRVSGG
jgi:hypothetical protein